MGVRAVETITASAMVVPPGPARTGRFERCLGRPEGRIHPITARAGSPRRPRLARARVAPAPGPLGEPPGRPVQSWPCVAPGARRRPSPGLSQGDAMKELARHIMVDFLPMKEFAENPLILTEGQGIHVTDVDGRRFIDGLSADLLRQPRPRQQAPRRGCVPPDRAAGPRGPDARHQRPGARAGQAPARHHAAPVHDGQAPLRRLGGDRGGDQDGPAVPQAGGPRDQVQDPVALPRLPRRDRPRPRRRRVAGLARALRAACPAGSSTSTPRIRTGPRSPAAPTRSAPRTRGSWRRSSSSRAPRRSRASSPSRS